MMNNLDDVETYYLTWNTVVMKDRLRPMKSCEIIKGVFKSTRLFRVVRRSENGVDIYGMIEGYEQKIYKFCLADNILLPRITE